MIIALVAVLVAGVQAAGGISQVVENATKCWFLILWNCFSKSNKWCAASRGWQTI